ncbi:hypothetical protein B0H12DRAFT_1067176 [Mycena haematopus]|nr:hypothetical protein B0H12DRAFT_1067176 [Mycena haematopus]
MFSSRRLYGRVRILAKDFPKHDEILVAVRMGHGESAALPFHVPLRQGEFAAVTQREFAAVTQQCHTASVSHAAMYLTPSLRNTSLKDVSQNSQATSRYIKNSDSKRCYGFRLAAGSEKICWVSKLIPEAVESGIIAEFNMRWRCDCRTLPQQIAATLPQQSATLS